MDKSEMLDPKWIRQNRRDCRILLAVLMGLCEVPILALVGAKLLIQPDGSGLNFNWLFIVILPLAMSLLFELVVIGDNIWLRRLRRQALQTKK